MRESMEISTRFNHWALKTFSHATWRFWRRHESHKKNHGRCGFFQILSVAYHFFNEEGTRYDIYEEIRTTYDGPLSLATDMMVWNVTKDAIVERMGVSTEEAWSVPGTAIQPPPQSGRADPMSDFTRDGELQQPVIEAQGPMMREFWEKWDVPLAPDVKKAYHSV